MREYYVYILRCCDDSYYTGVTNNVEVRVLEHQQGDDPAAYTYNRRPLELVYVQEFREINDAIAAEKQIKGWTRAKKEALIKQAHHHLHALAECKNATHFRNHQNDIQHSSRTSGFVSAQPDTTQLKGAEFD